MKKTNILLCFLLIFASQAQQHFFYDLSEEYLVWDKKASMPTVSKGQQFQVYQNNAFLGTIIVNTINEVESIACTHWLIDFHNTPEGMGEGSMIAIHGSNDPRPSKYQEIDINSTTYRKIFRDYLISEGVVNPVVSIQKIIKTDLENDGVDEVIIAATKCEDRYSPQKGDYSIIILRKIVGEKVVTSRVCGGMLSGPYSFFYSLIDVLDYDNDKICEIISSESAHEYQGTSGYKIDGETVKVDISEGSCVD